MATTLKKTLLLIALVVPIFTFILLFFFHVAIPYFLVVPLFFFPLFVELYSDIIEDEIAKKESTKERLRDSFFFPHDTVSEWMKVSPIRTYHHVYHHFDPKKTYFAQKTSHYDVSSRYPSQTTVTIVKAKKKSDITEEVLKEAITISYPVYLVYFHELE